MHNVMHSAAGCDSASLGKEGKPGGHATRKRSLFALPSFALPYNSHMCSGVDPPWKRHMWLLCQRPAWDTARKSTFTHVCRGRRYVAHMCPGSHCVGQMQTYSYFTAIGREISFCVSIALVKKCDAAAADDDVDKCVTP